MIPAKNQRSATITLPWPLKATFNFLSDADSYSTWQQGTEASGWLTRNRHQVGSSFFVKRSECGEPVRVTLAENLPCRKKTLLLTIGSEELTLSLEFFGGRESTLIALSVSGRNCAEAVFNGCLRELEHLRYVLDEEEFASDSEKKMFAARAVATGLSHTRV